MNDDLDRAVFELGFSDPVPLFPRFDAGFLDSVGLQKLVELFLPAPCTVVVVVLHSTGLGFADDRVIPARELHAEPSGGRVEKPDGLVFGRCKLETNTGGPDSLLVPDFSSDKERIARPMALPQPLPS